VLRADSELGIGEHRDRGLLSIYLLNLVHLRPGEAMFLPAGVLHSYLEGAGIEIMANSNNVLRGGLTPKHVDVPELLNNVVFEAAPAEILHAARVPGTQESVYETPAEEFELSRIEINESQPYEGGARRGVEILLLIDSEDDLPVHVAADSRTVELVKGRACLIPHGVAYSLRASRPATLYKARVP
jgi:mannose-6-phosphate isomerase class I